jgi:hypothetical protein
VTRRGAKSDPTGPLGVYGKTKLAGEQAVARCPPASLLFRTSWVYAARGNNFARTMLRVACERERLQVVADQIGAPTGADLIADVTAHALRSVCQRSDLAGLYHLVAGGENQLARLRQARPSNMPGKPAVRSALPLPPSKACRAVPTRCPPHARTTLASIPASCRRPLASACRPGKSASTGCWRKFSGSESDDRPSRQPATGRSGKTSGRQW